MNVLLLAPQPFYTERGTPIAVDLLLKALSARGDRVDLLTYHQGADRTYPGVRIFRIKKPAGVDRIQPGFSIKKLICDFAMAPLAASLARENKYDVVHAVEESVFIAMRLKRRFGTPYIYDMDSSLAAQMSEKSSIFTMALPMLRACENAAIRGACTVVPMCDAIADLARRSGAARIVTLRDISLLGVMAPVCTFSIREALPVKGTCIAYLGNLEGYQGIDLLLESFSRLRQQNVDATLAVLGGTPEHVDSYRNMATRLGVADRVHFTGPTPLGAMKSIFDSCDILVSPRLKGENTPMKIYSYMDSGKPVLATRLPTHTQVMDDSTAMLAAPEPAAFCEGMKKLVTDAALGSKLAAAAKQKIAERYSYAAYSRTVSEIYDGLSPAATSCHHQ